MGFVLTYRHVNCCQSGYQQVRTKSIDDGKQKCPPGILLWSLCRKCYLEKEGDIRLVQKRMLMFPFPQSFFRSQSTETLQVSELREKRYGGKLLSRKLQPCSMWFCLFQQSQPNYQDTIEQALQRRNVVKWAERVNQKLFIHKIQFNCRT